MATFELEHLTKRFGEHVAVDDVSASAEPGEVVGLIGANGSGKTTTMRMLLGHIRPSSGRAWIEGNELSRPAARVGVGFLPDDPPLDDRWSVARQLDWWERLRGPAPRRESIEHRLGLDRHKTIGELSRGNRQKVGIAMALMHVPSLIVLDEPATGLDPLVRQELWALLRFEADRGATVLFSSHVLNDVEHACDRVIVLRDGGVAFDGAVDALLADATRTIEVDFAAPVDPGVFTTLAGVDEVHWDDRRLTITFSGPADPVVKALARHEVIEVTASRPTLEGSFAHLNRSTT
ncbi:MAG: ABC transporter ATP-binding protein [Actinomycetota bacterium]